jgi:hypothetical protein
VEGGEEGVGGRKPKRPQHDPEWYLADPRTRKWMVQCPTCQRWGYKYDAPPDCFGRSPLERYFEALKPDEPYRQCTSGLSKA